MKIILKNTKSSSQQKQLTLTISMFSTQKKTTKADNFDTSVLAVGSLTQRNNGEETL